VPLLVFGQSLEMLASLVRRCRIAGGCPRERSIKMIFGFFKERARCPEKRLCLRSRYDRPPVVTCIKMGLQFSNPIPAGQIRGAWIILQMLLESGLVELAGSLHFKLYRR
jgi:hypothetical protein